MKTKNFFAILIAITIGVTLISGQALASVVGKFTSVEGIVDITSPGKEARAAAAGGPVSVGDFIRTKSKSRCEITYLDGNIIRLSEASRLRVTEYSLEKNNQTMDLFRGKVQSIVKTAAEVTGVAKGGRFEIHTPTAVAGVRGTNFFAYHQAGVSGFAFHTGTGYGYNRKMPLDVRTIRPGFAMLVTHPDAVPLIRPATPEELQRHEKDTAPGEKPQEKTESKKEEGKIVIAAGATDARELATGATDARELAKAAEIPTEGKFVLKLPEPPFIAATIADTPTPPPATVVTGTTFAAPLNLSFLSSGSLSGTISDTTNSGILKLSGTLNPSANIPNTWGQQLDFTLSNASAFSGALSAVSGSWRGLLGGIYVTADKKVGFLQGGLDGTSSPFEGQGTIVRGPTLGNVSFTPGELAGKLRGDLDLPLPLLGSITVGGAVGPDYEGEGDTILRAVDTTDGRILGYWSARLEGGNYQNPGGGRNWASRYGAWGGSWQDRYYMLTSNLRNQSLVTGTDDLAGHTTITGRLTYLDEKYLGVASLDYRGYYYGNLGNYRASGIGTYELTPLTMTGTPYGYLLYFDSEKNDLSNIGAASGLLGAVANPLLGERQAAVYMTGSHRYYGDAAPPGTLLLYGSGWYLEGEIGMDTPVTTDDAKYNGFFVGIWSGGQIERAKALTLYRYKGDNGAAGYLYGDFAGFFYNDLMMWEAQGELRSVEQAASTPEDNIRYMLHFEGTGAGSFGQGLGSLTVATVQADTIGYQDQPWGIWNMGLGGTYSGTPASSFTARIGGGGEIYYGYGYWLADLSGSNWQMDRFDAVLTNGRSLTPTAMYTFATAPYGTIYGTYANGIWQATGIGTYSMTPLAYRGTVAGAFGDWTSTHADVGQLGEVFGLLGGTGSLFVNLSSGVYTPQAFLALGNYGPEATGNLFFGKIDDGGIALQAGIFNIELGGVRLPDTNIFRTLGLGLYMRPTGDNTYEAGILSSGIFDLNLYPDLAMWEMPWAAGSLQATRMNADFRPEEEETMIYNTSIFGRVGGGGYIQGMAQALFSASVGVEYWGIFTASFGGQGAFPLATTTAHRNLGGMIRSEDGEYTLAYWIGTSQPELPQGGQGYFVGGFGGYFLGQTYGDIIGGRLLGVASTGGYSGILGSPYREQEMAFTAMATNSLPSFLGANSGFVSQGDIHGFGGALTSPFNSNSKLMLLGVYNNPKNYSLLRTTIAGEAYDYDYDFYFTSSLRAFALPTEEGAWKGKLIGPYYKWNPGELGVILSANVPLRTYAGINPRGEEGGGMWEVEGADLQVYPLATHLVYPQFMVENSTRSVWDPASRVTGFAGGVLVNFRDDTVFSVTGQPWRLIASTVAGTYTGQGGIPGAGTVMEWLGHPATGENREFRQVHIESVDANNVFSGRMNGAVVEWQSAKTFVQGGEIAGLFDPQKSSWRAIGTSALMETGAFLQMQGGATTTQTANATLKALNIPAVEVGRANLAQGPEPVNGLYGVTMHNVTFFANSTGGAPRIWATNNVSGNYSSPPVVPPSAPPIAVPLSGGGLNATFEINNWSVGRWTADVNGSGALTAGAYLAPIVFNGGAAGTFTGTTSGSLTGTAAGVAVSGAAAGGSVVLPQ